MVGRRVAVFLFLMQCIAFTWLCSQLFPQRRVVVYSGNFATAPSAPFQQHQPVLDEFPSYNRHQHNGSTHDGLTHNATRRDSKQSWNPYGRNNYVNYRKEIRKWGCSRQDTPFIFVHIGKSGGGSIRARLAASSLNYNKDQRWQSNEGSYYPIRDDQNRTIAAARFCSSCSMNSRPSRQGSFEKTIICHASSPIGQAVGCPEPLIRQEERKKGFGGECRPSMDTCHVVYVGHNLFGSEMHWLPSGYLKKWWTSTWSDDNPETDAVLPLFDKLHANSSWCDVSGDHRPATLQIYDDVYDKCSVPNQRIADAKAALTVARKLALDHVNDWSPVYASMPVLRAVLIRNPFSWLMSKYAWHFKKKHEPICHNLNRSIYDQARDLQDARPNLIEMDDPTPGWIPRMSLGYILYLCGEVRNQLNVHGDDYLEIREQR